MSVQYSSVCETDVAAYVNYLNHVSYQQYLDVLPSGHGGSDGSGIATLAEWMDGGSRTACLGGVGVRVSSGLLESVVRTEVVEGDRVDSSGGGESGSRPGVAPFGVSSGGVATGAGGDHGKDSSGVDDVGSSVVRGKHYEKNRAKREKRKRAVAALRVGGFPKVDGSGGCVSDESVVSVKTVDTRTAVEIEAAQSLARRRIAENELAVVQANRRVKSLSDEKKTLAFERLQGARLSQRINQANVAAQKAYAARDKSLTSVDSAGSAGEYAMRQEIKAARNSQFVNDYLRKQIDIFAKHADSSVIAAADRVPKPTLDDMYDVMKDQYDLTDPEQCAQLDADVAVENAKWNDVLYSGEGFMDEPASVKKPESGETLEELYAKVRAQDEQFDVAEREINAANRE